LGERGPFVGVARLLLAGFPAAWKFHVRAHNYTRFIFFWRYTRFI
jgi:hypothetical protein